MASKEINDFTEQTTANNNDEYLLQETGGGTTKKITLTTIIAAVKSSLSSSGDLNEIGDIKMFGSSSTPTNWLLCDGSAISRTTYSDLFSVISTTYGTGDGSTTFNLPDYQGVVPKGAGSQTINGRTKTGPSLGDVEEDRFQAWQMGFTHGANSFYAIGGNTNSLTFQTTAAAATSRTMGLDSTYQGATRLVTAKSDGTNGTPRTGDTTRENSLGTNFYIKYQ